MKINIINVEELVFYSDNFWKKMPDLIHLRDQWRISKISPTLKAMGRKALNDFLYEIQKKSQSELYEIFETEVTIDRIENRIIKNIEFSINDEFPSIDSEIEYTGFSSHREKDKVLLTFWR